MSLECDKTDFVYSLSIIESVFDGVLVTPLLPYSSPLELVLKQHLDKNNCMLQGVQPKGYAFIKDGRIYINDTNVISNYILKLNSSEDRFSYRDQMVINENLTMDIAEKIYGIITVAQTLCYTEQNEFAYLTKRFDCSKDGFLNKEDFMTLLNEKDKYDGSYEKVGKAIQKYSTNSTVDIQQFFKVVLFNYMFWNCDAHLMNFSILSLPDGENVLSPAYDLLNTSLHISSTHFALREKLLENDDDDTFYNENGVATYKTFKEFANRLEIGRQNFDLIVNDFLNHEDDVQRMIQNSSLSLECKKLYQESHNKIYELFKDSMDY